MKQTASFLVALLLLAAVCIGSFVALDYHWSWSGVWDYRQLFIKGWLATLAIAALALPLSTALGLALALARRCSWRPVAEAARIWVEVTRGTPLLVQLWIYWYVFGQALSRDFRFLAGGAILAAFAAAYVSEIIRGGLESVPASQIESARAIGLTRWQAMRHVVWPQALRAVLPSLAGQLASLIKDSSLLCVLGIDEFTQAASSVSSQTAAPFESYLPVAIGYLALTLPVSLWSQRLEKKLRYEN